MKYAYVFAFLKDVTVLVRNQYLLIGNFTRSVYLMQVEIVKDRLFRKIESETGINESCRSSAYLYV